MPNGEPEVQATEVKDEQIVLSQETQNEAPATDPAKEKTPEQRKADDQWAKQRIAGREWKKSIQDLRSNPHALLEEAAREEGFDPSKEENKGHLNVVANFEKKKNDREIKIKNEASNRILSETLSGMGIKPDSTKGYLVGTTLFKKYGIENPEVYTEDLVRRELESLSEEFVGKKDPVNDSIMRKASSNLPQKAAPKGTAQPSEDKLLSEEASRLGVSKERVKQILEKQKNKPKWA